MLDKWHNKTSATDCIRNLCERYKTAPQNAHSDQCTNVDVNDVPEDVANYVREHNRWYYENNPYLKKN